MGPGHPECAESARDLAEVLAARGEFDEAEQLYRDLLTNRRAEQSPGDPLLADALYWLGDLMLAQDRAVDAEPLLRECVDACARLSQGHRLNQVRRALGDCLVRLGQFERAEAVLLEAYGESAGLGTNVRKRQTLQAIIAMYEAWDRPADASERWRRNRDTSAGHWTS